MNKRWILTIVAAAALLTPAAFAPAQTAASAAPEGMIERRTVVPFAPRMRSTACGSGMSTRSVNSLLSPCATPTMRSPFLSWPLRAAGPPATSSRILQ